MKVGEQHPNCPTGQSAQHCSGRNCLYPFCKPSYFYLMEVYAKHAAFTALQIGKSVT